jgi:hypothetical protein
VSHPIAPAPPRQPSLEELSAPLARLGQGLRDELGLAMARFHEQLEAAGDELLLFGLAEPHFRPKLLELLERELEQALRSIQVSRAYSKNTRDDLLSQVEANDDLATYGLRHPRANIRDAAGELAELAAAGDEVLLYQSEVDHE